MKTSCQAAVLLVGVGAALTLCGCGRVGYDGGGLDGGDEPLIDAADKRDVTEHADAHDSGIKTADGHADTGKGRDAAKDTGAGDAATDTGAGDAVTEAAPGDGGDAGGSDAGADGGIRCTSASDCAAEMACDTTTGTCTTVCTSSQPCNGCCGPAGTCIAGPTGSVACVTLPSDPSINPQCQPAGTACPECSGPSVCGDGMFYGTATNTSYACSGGKIATPGTPCAFGCDSTTGACADLVAANAAGSHLAATDTFTCLRTQTSTLPGISATTGDIIAFDTTHATVTKNTTTTIGALWGTAYTPAGGGTSLIVAHVSGISLAPGASVTIKGQNALILLVDGDVSISGSTTIVDFAAHYSAGATPLPQPGAGTSTFGGGGAGTVTNQGGGGGGGHGVAGGTGGAGGTAAMTIALGGPSYGSPFVLVAGANGGGTADDPVGRGGGGLQISACGNISIAAGVLLNGSGGGGEGGTASSGGSTPPGGGFGGGSGGTLLLEGATANNLAGSLVANGGGGGAGATGNDTAGANGDDWPTGGAYNAVAPGGGPVGALGSGGAGGAGTTPPGNGISGSNGNGGGAGGGAYGAIYIGVSPIASTPNATRASPAPYYSHTCTTVDGVPPATCTY